jgi:hypothetical protein
MNWPFAYTMVILIWLTVALWYKLFPSVGTIHDFANTIDTRGANIFILVGMSLYFFRYSMSLFLLLIDLSKAGAEGKGYIGQDNAFALMALQMVSSTAFGGTLGALFKTMTGDSSRARIGDPSGDSTTTVTTSRTSAAETVVVKPPEPTPTKEG